MVQFIRVTWTFVIVCEKRSKLISRKMTNDVEIVWNVKSQSQGYCLYALVTKQLLQDVFEVVPNPRLWGQIFSKPFSLVADTLNIHSVNYFDPAMTWPILKHTKAENHRPILRGCVKTCRSGLGTNFQNDCTKYFSWNVGVLVVVYIYSAWTSSFHVGSIIGRWYITITCI